MTPRDALDTLERSLGIREDELAQALSSNRRTLQRWRAGTAYPQQLARQRLAELLGGSRRPVKLFLVDQGRIAGLGNIYSNEALWRAGLDPRRRTNRLSAVETRRLHKGIVDVLRRALECCLNPAPNFRDPEWWFQGLEKILGVYGREGKRCRRCGERIRRIAQGARSSYFCPGCQR